MIKKSKTYYETTLEARQAWNDLILEFIKLFKIDKFITWLFKKLKEI